MEKLQPAFRLLPYFLFAYAIVLTIANMAELRSTTSTAGLSGSFLTETRIIYLAALVRSFYDLFFLWAMAALVAGMNTLVDRGQPK